jgi:hypothetical protein
MPTDKYRLYLGVDTALKNDCAAVIAVDYVNEKLVLTPLSTVSGNLPMLEFAQSSPNLTAMSQNLFELIEHNNICIYASVELRNHAAHCVAVESTRGWRISKTKAANKIDGIVALGMACLQAVQNRDTGPMIIAAF